MSYTVRVGYDQTESRYFVIESDIPGLNVETNTFEEFIEVTKDLAPDLIGDAPRDAKIDFHREVALAS
jgi:predicted RNase H-like HicB family nuclease